MEMDLWEKVLRTVTEKGYYSITNNTKWQKLQEGIKTLPFPPPYEIKSMLTDYVLRLDESAYCCFWGDWSFEGFLWNNYFEIERVRVRPIFKKHRGMLLDPEVMDESDQFRALLGSINIPYEEDGLLIIYGYRKND